MQKHIFFGDDRFMIKMIIKSFEILIISGE